MKIWILAGAAATALMSAAANGQVTHSLEDDAAAFGAREAVSQPRLSPDGSSVMYVTPGPGPKSYAVISNLVTGKSNVVTGASGQDYLHWCNYSAADRVVCNIWAASQRAGYIIGFSRLFALNIDGSDPKPLGQSDSKYDEYIRQYDGTILDWGKGDGSVLMQREYVPEAGKIGSNIIRNKEGLGVDLVNTKSLTSVPVESPKVSTSGYMSDGRGNVRIMEVTEAQHDSTMTGRVKYYYHPPGSHDWKTLAEFTGYLDQIEPLAVDADINSVYVLKKKNGRKALYAIKLDGSLAETLVAENPRVDIDDVIRVGDGLRVIGYTFVDDKRRRVYFDREYKGLADSLSRALPKLPIVDFVDSTNDAQKLLIFAGSDNDPGRFYLFDRSTKQLNEAMLERPQLDGRTLAPVKSVMISGADGAQIPAYLTLPQGKDPRGLPAVVLPHGGPSYRDEWQFDWLVQFLAARGYAVLQPEYRGSAGYGDTWLNENGFQNWRTAMGDIASSAKWMASQGIADPNKIAIVGWSYGGYAALMEAETDPSLYKAVVAIAPVTDLQLLKEDHAYFTNARIVEQFVGTGPHIEAGSPLRHASAIQAPVLLVHGDMDQNVRVWHSEKMNAALRSAGKSVEFLEYKGLDHQLRDSAVRKEFLTHIGQLLDRTIGH